jgi:hypothetical protein
MTPEELEALPNISEDVVRQIQAAVMSFYGQYEEEQAEAVPADADSVETALDASGTEISAVTDEGDGETISAFENIETGVLERDLATHEAASLEDTEEGEMLDLGRVEGLSGAPSTLHNLTASSESEESVKSDTIETAD